MYRGCQKKVPEVKMKVAPLGLGSPKTLWTTPDYASRVVYFLLRRDAAMNGT